ncbi:MAG: hypothetical protein AB7O96_10525 [Pseudobdellovibrionaceae bacterium]
MNNLIGIALLVLSAMLAGGLLGGLFGFFSTAINNLVVSNYFGAAVGSYRWWIIFHLIGWAIGFGFISLCWGLLLACKGPTIPGTMG